MTSTELYWKIYCAALEGSSDYAPGIARKIREITLSVLDLHHIQPPSFPAPMDTERWGPYNAPMQGHGPVWVGTDEWKRQHETQPDPET